MSPAQRDSSGYPARIALLSATVLGTMCNNIVNVPLRSIATGLGAQLSAAVLLVSAFALALAIAMPLTGWLGDRLGMKEVLVGALVLMLMAQGLAAVAPNLPTLVTLRAVQGLACSAIPPMVMGMLGFYHPEKRLQMMAAWAAANGIGQAIGPPVGGIVSDALGWRMIFVLLAVVCLPVVVALWWWTPPVPRRPNPLDLRGAVLLTGGVGLVLVGLTTVGQRSAYLLALAAGVCGLLLLIAYVSVSRGRASAMIPLSVLVESRFLRSTASAFGQMFCLGTVLVAVPLIFTGPLALSSAAAGALLFMLPTVMAFGAPVSSRLSHLLGPRVALRSGLAVIVVGTVVTGLVAEIHQTTLAAVTLTGMMVVLGFGMALVQTPAAAGATSSAAAEYGAAIGLFNMMRFSASATAAAWVALIYPTGSMPLLFGGCALVALLAFALSFVGPDPVRMTPEPVTRTSGHG